MSLLGELLGPCRVGSYLFGCFILFFPPFPSPPFACRVPRRGGGRWDWQGRRSPASPEKSRGKEKLPHAHGCVGGLRAPLEPPPRGPAAAAAADRAAGERVSTAGHRHRQPVSSRGGAGRAWGREGGVLRNLNK